MKYRARVADEVLDEVLPHLGAVAIEGAKAVGKTATAARRAGSVLRLDEPAQAEALRANPDLITTLEPPLLIDEWQLVPQVWDQVRRAVDANPAGGRFLLTGSAQPPDTARLHSGAGRIVRLMLRPLSLAERGLCSPTVSLRALVNGTEGPISGTSPVTLSSYTDEVLASGFPGIRDLPDRPRGLQLDSYLDRIIDRDLPATGVTVRHTAALRGWLAAYAAATSTTADYTTILNAATPGESDKPARQTVAHYRDHLLRLFVLDPVDAWQPAFAPLARLTVSAKRHLVDPALAARLVGVGKAGLLTGGGARPSTVTGTWLGALFESLATQSVRIYADAIGDGARVGHLRTKNSLHEIDLIVHRPDLTCVPIEIKLAPTVSDHDVRHLNWLRTQLGDRVTDRVVLTTGPHAYRRPDGVAVVPLALLGP